VVGYKIRRYAVLKLVWF
jgi:hypothetical protein